MSEPRSDSCGFNRETGGRPRRRDFSARRPTPFTSPIHRLADGAFLPYESVVTAVDWNGDGDVDLLARSSYGYLCWFERSFLEHGYALANVTSITKR